MGQGVVVLASRYDHRCHSATENNPSVTEPIFSLTEQHKASMRAEIKHVMWLAGHGCYVEEKGDHFLSASQCIFASQNSLIQRMSRRAVLTAESHDGGRNLNR